jgi:hypothetical protein
MSLEELVNALGGNEEGKCIVYGTLSAMMQDSEKRSHVAGNAGMFSRIAVSALALLFTRHSSA